MLLTAVILPLFGGCGDESTIVATKNVTSSGTIYLVVIATPTNTQFADDPSAAFEAVDQRLNQPTA